jgi:hypothetical protein
MPSSIKPGSSSQPSGLAQRIRVAPEETTLVVWPLKERPVESLLLLAAAAGLSCFAGWWTRQPLVAGGVAAALAVTLWRTWLPVTFEIGLSGIKQTVLGRSRRISWSAIRSYEIQPNGVLLSPDAQLVPLSALRGLYLPWQGQREKVLAHVEYFLEPPT